MQTHAYRISDRLPQQKPLWAKAIAQPAEEFGLTPLKVLAGAVPEDLRGTLYRNGPARLQRQSALVNHWFDGDGAILAVQFRETGVTATYRYVHTEELQAEDEAGTYLFAGYGQKAAGPIWKRWGAKTKNAANTSVLALPDKLLALWEGGNPHALDLETLATWGLDQLGGLQDHPYSAHPKRDPQTGEIYNFGIVFGAKPRINLYRSDATGKIIQQGAVALDQLSLIHDFAIAGQYLVFFVPPVRLQIFPILLGLQSFSEAMQWQPQTGTQIIVVDRETLQEVQRFTTDPWYQWHFGNGFVDAEGAVVIDYVRYQDFHTNQWLKEVVSGNPQTPALAQLWQLRFDPKTGKIFANAPRFEQHCEFPIVPPLETGQPSAHLYLAAQASSQYQVREMFDSLVQVNPETGDYVMAHMGDGCYPMEPIYVHHPTQPDQGWIVTVVFDGNQNQSTVQIFAAQQLDAGPVAVLALPQVIPFGFHGTWQSAR